MSNKKTKKYMHKLGENDEETGYVKPEKTQSELMSDDEIKKILENYTKVKPSELIKGDHVRYFVVNPNKTVSFRLGGYVLKNEGLPDYIVLTNYKSNWSVQCVNAIFYKLMNQTETIENYKTLLTLKNDKIEDLEVELNDANENVKNIKEQLKEKTKENAILLKHNKMMTKELTKKDKQIQKLEETIKKLQKK
jgi:hypothetical protein